MLPLCFPRRGRGRRVAASQARSVPSARPGGDGAPVCRPGQPDHEAPRAGQRLDLPACRQIPEGRPRFPAGRRHRLAVGGDGGPVGTDVGVRLEGAQLVPVPESQATTLPRMSLPVLRSAPLGAGEDSAAVRRPGDKADVPGLAAARASPRLLRRWNRPQAESRSSGGQASASSSSALGEGRLGRGDVGGAHQLRVVALAPGQQERVLKPVAALLRHLPGLLGPLFRVEGTPELLLDVGVAGLQFAVVVDAAAEEGDERDCDDDHKSGRCRPPPRPT